MDQHRPPSGIGPLDIAVAEGLLAFAGTAQNQHPRLASLLTAAAALVPGDRLIGEEAALAAFRAELTDRPDGQPPTRAASSSTKARLLAIALAGGLVGGGVAAAAAGSLPDPAQQLAKDVLNQLGVDVPAPDEAGVGSTVGHEGGAGDDPPSTSQDPGHGEEVSQLARTTTETGVDKGALISDVASDGQSKAGEHAPPVMPTIPPMPDTPAAEQSDAASTARADNANRRP